MRKNLLSIFIFVFISFLFSCKKDSFITSSGARVNITDSIKFDTVFTTTGSVTKSFKIFNDNSQKLLISKIKLAGGNTSSFKININGTAAVELNDVEMEANDSLYVFVSVNINPSTVNLPFIISDSIQVTYNGINRFVQLQAYGQNAIFLRNTVISNNTTWNNLLPYVILDNIRVDTAAILNISAGTKIYIHANAAFLVDGTLLLNGTKSQKVVFTGDRLDEPYRNFPASWPGISIRGPSSNNIFNFAIIKNANQAISISGLSLNANPKLIVRQTIIDNAIDAGLLCFNSNVQVSNTLISNCGSNIVIQSGGNYIFTHCTVASYSNQYLMHSKPVLTASDFVILNGAVSYAPLDALFRNCIFWGDNNLTTSEVIINKQGTNPFNVTLDHCLYKAVNDPPNTTFISVIKNVDPAFDSIDFSHNYFDFRVTKNITAPGIDKGIVTSFPKDLDDNPRNIGLPDIGSYEKQ